MSGAGAERRLAPNSGQVSVARSEDQAVPDLIVTIQAGAEAYPDVRIESQGAPAWNLAASLPDDFVIDYVRVWHRRDPASSVDGKPSGSKM
jgi:hypothetical protein